MARTALAGLTTAGLAVLGMAMGSAATLQENPVVAVVLDDPRGLVTRGGTHAAKLVEGIYRAAGVTVMWGVPSTGDIDRRLTVTFITTKTAPRASAPRPWAWRPARATAHAEPRPTSSWIDWRLRRRTPVQQLDRQHNLKENL